MFWVEVTRGCDGLFAKSPRKRREEETADQANGTQQNAVDAGHSLQLTPHLASLPQSNDGIPTRTGVKTNQRR